MSHPVENIGFNGVRTVVTTAVGFDEVLSRLRARMGRASVQEIVALAKTPISQEAYVREVEERFVGESGFMLFAPVELLVTEDEDGPGTTLTYVRPSSLMVTADNPPLLAAATALDEKYDRLVALATSVRRRATSPSISTDRGRAVVPAGLFAR